MDELQELFQPIIDFILGNIGIVIFALFLLSGLFGRGDRNKEQRESSPTPQRQARPEGEVDDRPLAERLAEAFGVEVPEEQARQQQQQQQQSQSRDGRYSSEGRRSTVRRNVQQEYPQLFGGPDIFDNRDEEEDAPKWGFDDTEWGTTFERSEEQWGNTFPDRKSSEPRIEWPT